MNDFNYVMPWEAPIRKIIHVDMDAFFASVEQRDNPEWKGKPLVVGGNRDRGVVAAASYEARKYGIHSAMPSRQAAKLCPDLIFAKGNFAKYKEVSEQVFKIFREYTDVLESVSIDEAYLDVTENKKNIEFATEIAKQIRAKIFAQTHLTASAGVSFCKFLAKVGSDYRKPNGISIILPEHADEFVDNLKIGKIPGIGKVTEQKMNDLGIFFGKDLQRVSKYVLERSFGKLGIYFYDLVRFDINNPVSTEHKRKSLGAERTYNIDKVTEDDMLASLLEIANTLSERLKKADVSGKTLTLKIKYNDFVVQSRSKTVNFLINSATDIYTIASELLFIPIKPIKPVRLLGIQISNLDNHGANKIASQLTLDFYSKK